MLELIKLISLSLVTSPHKCKQALLASFTQSVEKTQANRDHRYTHELLELRTLVLLFLFSVFTTQTNADYRSYINTPLAMFWPHNPAKHHMA